MQKSTGGSEGWSWTAVGIILLIIFIILGLILWFCCSSSPETEASKKTKKKRKRTTNCKGNADPMMDISSPSLVDLGKLTGPYSYDMAFGK